MARLTRLSAIIALLAVAPCARAEEANPFQKVTPPTWHDANGYELASGILAGLTLDRKFARVVKIDKSTAEIPIDSLSAADRAYVGLPENSDSEFGQVVRQWTSANRKFRINAKAVSTDTQTAVLVREDKKLLKVPLEKLGNEDCAYLERLQKAIAPPAKGAAPPAAEQNIDSVASVNGSAPASAPDQTQGSDTVTKYTTADDRKQAADEIWSERIANGRHRTAGRLGVLSSQAESRSSPTSSPSTRSPDVVGRNPFDQRVTGYTATGFPTFTGPRGGRYHYSKSGKKVYERRKR